MNLKYTPALTVGGGHIAVTDLQLHDDQVRELPDKKFCPDCGISVGSDLAHRVVAEIELENRGPPKVLEYSFHLLKVREDLRFLISMKISSTTSQRLAGRRRGKK